MTSQLPPFPRFVFSVLEPISLLSGAIPAILSPDWFHSEQIPSLSRFFLSSLPDLSQQQPITGEYDFQLEATRAATRTVTRQLGNCYGLAFWVCIAVLWSSHTPLQVVRNYLVALWIADIGHIAISCMGIGSPDFLDVIWGWNAMAWGNIGFTLFLFLTRTAYLLGLFGPGGQTAAAPPQEGEKAKEAKKKDQ